MTYKKTQTKKTINSTVQRYINSFRLSFFGAVHLSTDIKALYYYYLKHIYYYFYYGYYSNIFY